MDKVSKKHTGTLTLLIEAFNKCKIFIGLSGVADDELTIARRWAKRFEGPMILLAVWIIIEWYLREKGVYSVLFDQVTDWVIWLFFVVETVLLTTLVTDKLCYLKSNWMNLFIICLGMPLLWDDGTYVAALRSFRVLLIIPLLFNVTVAVRTVLARNHLGTVLLVALAFTLLSGLLIAGIDPSIENVWQGIWWAWVTISTVGYGDIVPQSVAGKVFGSIVILFGVGFFSLLTASFSAYFVSRGEMEIEEEEIEEINQLKEIEQRIDAMEKTLLRIEHRLNENQDDK